jgi:hypothetical protein
MQMKSESFICDGCGKEQTLRPGRHWCNCNPMAPFEMVPARVRRVTNKVIKSFLKTTPFILSDVIKRWVNRFLSNDPKAQFHQEQSELKLSANKKDIAEARLRANGFVKGLDGIWRQGDWWKAQNRP